MMTNAKVKYDNQEEICHPFSKTGKPLLSIVIETEPQQMTLDW